MKIVYNPKSGAPIKNFIRNSILLDPHFPDGYEIPNGTMSNGLKQYDDEVAEAIVETFSFLSIISEEEAKKILERPDKPMFRCDFPGCSYSSHVKIGLIGHRKIHAKDLEEMKKPVIDPNLIPIAQGKHIQTLAETKKMMDNKVEIPNGKDLDGVSWYGEGVKIVNKSTPAQFSGVRQPGKGHFVG